MQVQVLFSSDFFFIQRENKGIDGRDAIFCSLKSIFLCFNWIVPQLAISVAQNMWRDSFISSCVTATKES